MPQAKNLEDAINNLRNEPLESKEDFEQFFVDTTDVRGGDEAFPSLKRALLADPLGSRHYLFTGAKGCGKSTELLRLKLKLENEDLKKENKPVFCVAHFSVKNELEPFNLTHIDLLIASMTKLFEAAEKCTIDVDEEFLMPILNWTKKVTSEEKTTKGYGGGAEAGVEGGTKFFGLLKIFGKLTARAKYDKEFTKTIHGEEEHLISELIESSNILITEIKNKLRIRGMGLLVIIEDLDKLDVKKAEEIFFNYVSRLVALNVNTIYTFPISLYYNARAIIAQQAVDQVFVMPMIKPRTIEGNPCEDGIQLLKNLLEKRMDLQLFEKDAVIMNFINYSGGVIFDLFRMVNTAINFALNRDSAVIKAEHWKRAWNRAIDDYRSMISDRVEEDKVIVSAESYYDALKRVAEDNTKQPNNTREELELRQNLCLLSYNDKGWVDVHPLVKEILIEKKLIDVKYRIGA